MKLKAGNSDLYGGAAAPTDSIVLKRLGELHPGLSGAALAATHAQHKYDLVFYYKYESHDQDVAAYLTAANVESLNGEAITDLTAWTSAGEGRSFSASELNADGTAITKYGGKIEPHHSDNASDYFTGTSGESSITRYVEYYKITYTVTDGDQIYVVSRDVKLRYKTGDVNLDGYANSTDATIINAYGLNKATPICNPDGSVHVDLCLMLCDFNYDGYGNSTDATIVNACALNKGVVPLLRF